MATVHIANHSAREISFYQPSGPGLPIAPVRIHPGKTAPVDSALWDKLKAKPEVKALLDRQALEEVKKPLDSVPIGVEKTADPEIPDHLKEAEQVGAQTGQTAKLVKAEAKTIEVPVK